MTRLLHLDAKWPTPGSDAASQRTVQLVEALVALGFEVDLAVLFAQETATHAEVPIQMAGARPVRSPTEADVLEHIHRHGTEYEVAVVAWTRVAQRVIGPLRAANPRLAIFFDTNDVNHVREYRHARVSGNVNLLRRALAVKQAELAAAAASDVVIAISDDDAAVFRRESPSSRVEVIPLTVDEREGAPPGPAGRSGAIYLGNYFAWHNIDAISHFVQDVAPELAARGHHLPLIAAGAGRNELLDAVAGEGVEIGGYVPDLAAAFDRRRMFVAPLRIGSGVKGKLLAAFVHGLPVVATPVALEGIPARDGRDCLVATTPAELAAACIRLDGDDDLWRRLSTGGRRLVAEHFSRGLVRARVADVFGALVGQAGTARAAGHGARTAGRTG